MDDQPAIATVTEVLGTENSSECAGRAGETLLVNPSGLSDVSKRLSDASKGHGPG